VIQLHCGDCLDFLRTLDAGSVDAVVTDPPYGIAHRSNGQRFLAAREIAGDESTDLAEAIVEWAARGPLCMFFSPYRPLPVKWRSVLVWNKGAHVGIGGDRATCWKRDFELIGIRGNRPLNGQRDSAMLHIPALLPPPSGHVAEKPVKLMAYLIRKLTKPGDTVFDPCMGSGSTGVACVATGRNFIGCELDPDYHVIAQRRIAAEQAKHPLFAST
jgi:site-specific DNA-methyltransferase (adenine-specific)